MLFLALQGVRLPEHFTFTYVALASKYFIWLILSLRQQKLCVYFLSLEFQWANSMGKMLHMFEKKIKNQLEEIRQKKSFLL